MIEIGFHTEVSQGKLKNMVQHHTPYFPTLSQIGVGQGKVENTVWRHTPYFPTLPLNGSVYVCDE